MSLTTGHVVSSTRGLLLRALRSRALRSRARPPTTAVASLTTAAPQRAAVVASGSLPGSLTGSGCSFRASPSYPSSLASIASTARRRSTIILQAATADARVAEETDVEMLGHAADRYGGVIVDPETLPDTVDAFADRLEASIAQWIAAGVRGVWLKIPKERAEFVGVAVHSGKFGFHHAEPGYVMMTRWLPNDEPDMLPPNASPNVRGTPGSLNRVGMGSPSAAVIQRVVAANGQPRKVVVPAQGTNQPGMYQSGGGHIGSVSTRYDTVGAPASQYQRR